MESCQAVEANVGRCWKAKKWVSSATNENKTKLRFTKLESEINHEIAGQQILKLQSTGTPFSKDDK